MKSYEELYPKVNNDTVSLKNTNLSVTALEESVLKKLHSSVDFRKFALERFLSFNESLVIKNEGFWCWSNKQKHV